MRTRTSLRFAIAGLATILWSGFFATGCSAPNPGADRRAIAQSAQAKRASGVCPPFPLRNEKGEVINPTGNVNAAEPYSPKQTCGAKGCHDYEKITQGFHFQQGKGEKPPAQFAARYNWVSSPGNYGGNWCSPAPLYRQLAAKKNTNARTIDMTSFDFITATCGNCHPGGGPMEYDRDGERYDARMANPASGLTPGGENGLDGDYYKARWSETGVIEADCLLCHMPEYDYKKRNAQLANLNFRWAATEGAGFATVAGKVAAGEKPKVTYNRDLFDADGNVTLHIAPQPRNETCLNCHAKPDWKKRGASFAAHTDVHFAKGLKCVDCHTSGSRASDPRIRGKEVHQFGKGDDPSGWVRNDLDNTVRTCESCHAEGTLGAPVARHTWLPPFHMEKIACVACHIPQRYTKAARVQASDVFNPAPRITLPPKHIWTFYDQDMRFWNHYGELDLFTVKDQPVDESRPELARYKGKIYPVNRVHSAWVGYEEEGKPGLNELFMKDFYTMWLQHKKDPSQYSQLAKIRDDNGDGMIEVNRPEEIDALIEATTAYLKATSFPLEGKRLVYVSDDRKYYDGATYRDLPRESHEATPYASVYKYSHNVLPARSALGAKGCTDCHSAEAQFFYGDVLDRPFTESGASSWIPNYRILDLSPFSVGLGAFREQRLKPALYLLMALIGILLAVLTAWEVLCSRMPLPAPQSIWWPRLAALAGVACFAVVLSRPGLFSYMTFDRFKLDANHFWVALGVLAVSLWTALDPNPRLPKLPPALVRTQLVLAAFTVVCGGFMIVQFGWLEPLCRYAYTGFDLGLTLLALGTSSLLVFRLVISTTPRHKSEVQL